MVCATVVNIIVCRIEWASDKFDEDEIRLNQNEKKNPSSFSFNFVWAKMNVYRQTTTTKTTRQQRTMNTWNEKQKAMAFAHIFWICFVWFFSLFIVYKKKTTKYWFRCCYCWWWLARFCFYFLFFFFPFIEDFFPQSQRSSLFLLSGWIPFAFF